MRFQIAGAGLVAGSESLEGVFEEYESARKQNTDALAELALLNFVEMRARVATRWFHWRDRAEKTLHRWFPDRSVPLYSMVTFARIPYAEAVRRSQRQDRLLSLLLASWLLVAVLATAGLIWGLSIRW